MDLWKCLRRFVVLLAFFSCLKQAEVEAATINRGLGDSRQPKIFGGSLIGKREQITYHVSLSDVKTESFLCSGVIMDPYLILTAAHCLTDRKPSQFQVTAGTKYRKFFNNSRMNEVPQRRNVSGFYIHEDYNTSTKSYNNDVGIIVLKTPLDFTSSNVDKITLPQQDESFIGSLTVTGWGNAAGNWQQPQVLKKLTIPIVQDVLCVALLALDEDIDHNYNGKMCAGNGTHDACRGDSGGPAVCKRESFRSNASPILCGIVSYGPLCGKNPYRKPGIFTNVAYYVNWIYKTMRRIYSGLKCQIDQFYCPSSKTCIPNSYVCDGDLDCIGGEDESECLNYNSCNETNFVCNNGDCVSNNELCNGVPNCGTYEDEFKCNVLEHEDCTGLYQCDNRKTCIPEDWKCDGNNDCDDGSDEIGCNGTTEYAEPTEADSEIRTGTPNTTTTAEPTTNTDDNEIKNETAQFDTSMEIENETKTLSRNTTTEAKLDTNMASENAMESSNTNTTTPAHVKPTSTLRAFQSFLNLLTFG